jgi:hypothetical protein
MNPLKYAQMMKYLTRAKKANPELPDVFPASKAPIPPVKQEVKEIEAVNQFMLRNPRVEKAGGGMLVQPSADGSRPGYAGERREITTKVINKLDLDKKKIKLNGDDFITGKVQSYIPEGVGKKYVDEYLSFVDKNYLKNDMSMVEPFQAYIKNKYPKKYFKIISDVNESGYRGLKGISTTYKTALANELITAANNQLKFVNQFDIIKKLVSPKRAAAYEKSGGLSARPPEWADKNTLNNFKNLDKMENKLSKALTYMVENNVTIIDPKKVKIPGSGGYREKMSPIKKMMHYLVGGGSAKNLNKALEINPWYQSQNFKVGGTTKNTFDYLSKQYAKDFIGQPFNDAYDFALQRRGRITLTGMSKQPLPENLIWEFAARSAQRNFTDGVPIDQWPVKILDKKGNVVDLGKFPVDSAGRKIIDTTNFQFEYNGEIFNRKNLKTTGVQSGFFNDIYKISSKFDNYLKQQVPDPDNPKKTISLGELFRKTEGRIFPTVGHDDARGGVKKRPFNSFKILTNVENQALFNAYDKIKNPQTRRNVVDFIYGETKGLRGDRYKEAWTNKNVNFVTEYIKTGQGLEQTPYKQAVTMPPKKLEKEILNKIQSYSKLPQCKVSAADGGRIGFAFSDECIRDGLKEQKIEAQKGNKKAARELVQVGKVATRAGLLKNILGPGAILGEVVFEGALIGNKVLGGTPADIAYAESYLSYLDPKKYIGELDPLKMRREDMLTREVEDAEGNIKTINAPGFSALKSGFEAQDQLSAFNKAIEDRDDAKTASRIDLYNPAAADAREQGARADQSANIISSESFKDASKVAQEYLQGQTGANIAKYRTDDFGAFESGRDKDLRRRRMQEMSDIMPRDFLTATTSDLLNYTQALRELGYDTSTRKLMEEQEAMRAVPLSVDARMYSPEQVYGTQGEFAGGGIAKLAGDSSGRPPASGPNSQGLLSLKNRVRNY